MGLPPDENLPEAVPESSLQALSDEEAKNRRKSGAKIPVNFDDAPEYITMAKGLEAGVSPEAQLEISKPDRKICGLTRRNFLIVLTIGLLLVTAAAIGGGVGGAKAASKTAISSPISPVTAPPATGTIPGVMNYNPTTPVPVSGALGTLQPTAAAQAQEYDATATRFFTGVSIKAPNGQCLFVNPQAGDFRENTAPLGLVDCAGSPNERWDLITAGKHNDGTNHGALIVSDLMNGCVNYDGRNDPDDRVNVFSCGGRADGTGTTDGGQLIPFPQAISADGRSLIFAPISENNVTCMTAGNGRVNSTSCTNDGTQVFTIV